MSFIYYTVSIVYVLSLDIVQTRTYFLLCFFYKVNPVKKLIFSSTYTMKCTFFFLSTVLSSSYEIYSRISSYLLPPICTGVLFNIFVQYLHLVHISVTIITDLKLIAGDAWRYAKFVLSQTTLYYV